MSTQKEKERLELLQGTLDLLILRTLIFGPQHGQGIARAIQQTSEDELLDEHGARSAAAGSGLPTLGSWSLMGIDIEGQPEMPPGLRPDIPHDVVSTDYFQTLGIPLMAGRGFNDHDLPNTVQAAIVNQAFVREFFSGQNPIGKHVGRRTPPGSWREIIGVVGNVRQLGPVHDESPEFYTPYQQEPTGEMNLVLRTASEPRHWREARGSESRFGDLWGD